MKQMLVENSIFQDSITILEEGKLIEYFHESKSENNCLGNIYKCRVINILPGIQAAFVDIGMASNAYLHIDSLLSNKFLLEKKIKRKEVKNISEVIKKGDELLVQVIREPIGNKGVSVTTDVSLQGKCLALIPGNLQIAISKKISDDNERRRLKEIGKKILIDDMGIIFRTFSKEKDFDKISKEYNFLLSRYTKIENSFRYSYAPKLLFKNNSLIERIIKDYIDETIDEIYVENDDNKKLIKEIINNYDINTLLDIKKYNGNLFEYHNLNKQIENLFDKVVKLESGGSIIIESTEAMTIVDVNSGSFVGKNNFEKTAYKINMEAAEEIARQVKLRDISGIIIIDFINMKIKANNDKIINKMKEIFKKDKAKTNIIGMTKLNLLEITRSRDKNRLFVDAINCPTCGGNGKVFSNILVLSKIENILKRLSIHTTCDAAILKVNEYLKKFIETQFENKIRILENAYDVSLLFVANNDLKFNEIKIEKMGKKSYINNCINNLK